MEPGRELDKLVAEAMGWTNVNSEDYPALGLVYHGFPLGENITHWLPYYSTDWAAAGKAWEWLEATYSNDYTLALVSAHGLDDDPPAVAKLSNGEICSYLSTGQTYPHAIALAVVEAVKAKGMLT